MYKIAQSLWWTTLTNGIWCTGTWKSTETPTTTHGTSVFVGSRSSRPSLILMSETVVLLRVWRKQRKTKISVSKINAYLFSFIFDEPAPSRSPPHSWQHRRTWTSTSKG